MLQLIEGKTDEGAAVATGEVAESTEQVWDIYLEPEISAEQVGEVEVKIGEGLLEEVVEQAWAESRCVEVMLEDKCWEPLEVQPIEGQWVGYDRSGEAEQRVRE